MVYFSIFLFLLIVVSFPLGASPLQRELPAGQFFHGLHSMFLFLLITFNFLTGLKTKKKIFFLFLTYFLLSNLLIFETNLFEEANLFNMDQISFKRYVILSFLTLVCFFYFLKEFFKTDDPEKIRLRYIPHFMFFLAFGFILSFFFNSLVGISLTIFLYLISYIFSLNITYLLAKETKIAKIIFTSLVIFIPISFLGTFGIILLVFFHLLLLNIGVIEKISSENGSEISRSKDIKYNKDFSYKDKLYQENIEKLMKNNMNLHKEMKNTSLDLEFERATLEDFLIHSHQKKIERDNILSGLEQGYLTFNGDGIISEGATQKVEQLLETSLYESEVEKIKIWDVLTKKIQDEEVKERTVSAIKKWVGYLFSNKLKIKDVLHLAPKKFINHQGKSIHLNFRPIFNEKKQNVLNKIILIVTDKTEQEKLKFLQEKDHEEVQFIKYGLQNPLDLNELIRDTYETIDKNQDIIKNKEVCFRQFHTLKARFGQFRLRSFSSILNSIEDSIHTSDGKAFNHSINIFSKNFEDLLKENDLMIQAVKKFLVQEGNAIEANRMIELIVNAQSLEELHINVYNDYILVDIRKKLNKYHTLINQVASKQDKKIRFEISGDKILVEYNKYAEFINSLIHIFRNMIDHGIESQEERKKKGKPFEASIKVQLVKNKDCFLIIFSDDGKGLDLEKIKLTAIKSKIKTKSEVDSLSIEEVYNLIFSHGFSTRDSVDDISGRGIGMEAVLTEVINLGGSISVSSEIDIETKFTVKLPI